MNWRPAWSKRLARNAKCDSYLKKKNSWEVACGLEVKSICFSRWGPAFSSYQSQLLLTPVPEGSRVFWPLKASHVLGAQTSRPPHANVTKIHEKSFKKQSVLLGFNCQLDTVLSSRGGKPWLRTCLDQIARWACLDYQGGGWSLLWATPSLGW